MTESATSIKSTDLVEDVYLINCAYWFSLSRNTQEYLQGNPMWMEYCKVPLMTLGFEKNYDVFVKVHGGGLSGQAQAICLGVARALVKISNANRVPLKSEGLLTRDTRIVERKKAGLKKARKRPQFSKRWGRSLVALPLPEAPFFFCQLLCKICNGHDISVVLFSWSKFHEVAIWFCWSSVFCIGRTYGLMALFSTTYFTTF